MDIGGFIKMRRHCLNQYKGANRGLGCPQRAKRAAAGGGAWNGMSERISRSIACLRQIFITIVLPCQVIIAGTFLSA